MNLFYKILFCIILFTSNIHPITDQKKIDIISKLYNWLSINKDINTGIPFSHVGDPSLYHFGITYDCAVTSMAYMSIDKNTDAKKILDFFINQRKFWRLGGIIEVYNLDTMSGVDWSVRTGANTWMGLAFYHGYKKYNNTLYLDYAKKIAENNIRLQNIDSSNINYGGISLGPKGDPRYPTDQRLGFKVDGIQYCKIYSTEIAIDNYALFNFLYNETKDIKYSIAKNRVFEWIKNVAYNKNESRFNRGSITSIDTIVSTDVNSWGISSLGIELLNTLEENLADKMISFINNNCLNTVNYKKLNGKNVKIKGYDFISNNYRIKDFKRKPLVSPEWTCQVINALSTLIKYYTKHPFKQKKYFLFREELITNMIALGECKNDTMFFPYATLFDVKIGHEHNTPKEGNLSTIGVSYFILSLMDCDPLSIET